MQHHWQGPSISSSPVQCAAWILQAWLLAVQHPTLAPITSQRHWGKTKLHSWSTAAQPGSQTTLLLRRIFFSLLSQKSMWNWTWSRNLPFLLNMQGNREVFNRLWRICSYSPSHWANITFLTTDSWTPTLATWPLFSILLQWILSILLCETLGTWSTRHYPHQPTFKGYEDGRFLNHRTVVPACVSEQKNASLRESLLQVIPGWLSRDAA